MPTDACVYCAMPEPRHEPQVPIGPEHHANLDRLARAFGEIHRRKQAGEPINLDEILPRHG